MGRLGPPDCTCSPGLMRLNLGGSGGTSREGAVFFKAAARLCFRLFGACLVVCSLAISGASERGTESFNGLEILVSIMGNSSEEEARACEVEVLEGLFLVALFGVSWKSNVPTSCGLDGAESNTSVASEKSSVSSWSKNCDNRLRRPMMKYRLLRVSFAGDGIGVLRS